MAIMKNVFKSQLFDFTLQLGDEANVGIKESTNSTIDFGKFNGDENPGTIISMNNSLYVEMNSYHNNTCKGFLAHYESGMNTYLS